MAWKVAFVVLMSLVCSITGTDGKANYEGAKVINLLHPGYRILNTLVNKAGLDVWTQNQTNAELLVKPNKLKSVERYLDKKGVEYSVGIANVQQRINAEYVSNKLSRRTGGFSLESYHRLNDIYSWMETLHKKYPDRVSIELVGYSYEKRPIKCLKISSGVPGAKAAFIDGGIHAREWVSTATVLYIINEVVENRAKQPEYLKNLDFYFLPVFNPDGYEYTHTTDRLWRKSRSRGNGRCLGVDLNRNFDAHFGGIGTSGDTCQETYRGPAAFSEPETRAFSQFFMKIRKNVVAYIAFHSYSQLILLPYAYDHRAYPVDYKELEAIGKKAASEMIRSGGERYGVGTPGDILYPAAGGSYDWVKDKAGVKYAFTYELRDTGRYGFILPTRFIRPTAMEAFAGVKVMLESATKRK